MDMLYENLEDISKTKTNSVSRILHGIQRKFEFSFRVWKTETRNEAERNRKKNLQSLFELMQDHLKYNTTMLYRNEQENKKRIQAIKYKK